MLGFSQSPDPLGYMVLVTPRALSPNEAGDLIRRRRMERGLTQEQVAEALNIRSANYITSIETGRVGIARSKYLSPLARVIGLTPDDLRQINPDVMVEFVPEPSVVAVEAHRVPVRTMAAAGPAFYTDGAVVSHEYVSDAHYRVGMLIVRVVGESMAPTLNDGDNVFVDTTQLAPHDGRIYLVNVIGDGYILKRARKLGESWFLMSDNPAHGPLAPEEATIVGRVYYRQPKGDML